jgi:hypothetical protein
MAYASLSIAIEINIHRRSPVVAAGPLNNWTKHVLVRASPHVDEVKRFL